MFGLILFIIFRGKRVQRIIPVISKLDNATVAFTRTIGELYYQHGDFTNIIEKKINLLDKRIKRIYIEQSLQSFRSGFSSAKTLSILSKINGVVSWICYQRYAIEPEYLAATSARKQCGIIVPRGFKAKEIVLNYVLDNVPEVIIEYTKHGNPKPQCYDMADSWVVAYAGWLSCQKKEN